METGSRRLERGDEDSGMCVRQDKPLGPRLVKIHLIIRSCAPRNVLEIDSDWLAGRTRLNLHCPF